MDSIIAVIKTKRLNLRSIGENDLDQLFEIFSNDEVMRYWSSPPLKNRIAAQALLREIQEGLQQRSFLNELYLHRLEADVDPRNVKSIKTLERLGFTREGYLRERWQVNGEIQDALFYGLLKPEWQRARAAQQPLL
ncbi:MAG TPA: GNAT family protein [Pyrinomonadaceae bacterium]|nr:GNAT family protein [Pyrinomonadaceae bacterium]